MVEEEEEEEDWPGNESPVTCMASGVEMSDLSARARWRVSSPVDQSCCFYSCLTCASAGLPDCRSISHEFVITPRRCNVTSGKPSYAMNTRAMTIAYKNIDKQHRIDREEITLDVTNCYVEQIIQLAEIMFFSYSTLQYYQFTTICKHISDSAIQVRNPE